MSIVSYDPAGFTQSGGLFDLDGQGGIITPNTVDFWNIRAFDSVPGTGVQVIECRIDKTAGNRPFILAFFNSADPSADLVGAFVFGDGSSFVTFSGHGQPYPNGQPTNVTVPAFFRLRVTLTPVSSNGVDTLQMTSQILNDDRTPITVPTVIADVSTHLPDLETLQWGIVAWSSAHFVSFATDFAGAGTLVPATDSKFLYDAPAAEDEDGNMAMVSSGTLFRFLSQGDTCSLKFHVENPHIDILYQRDNGPIRRVSIASTIPLTTDIVTPEHSTTVWAEIKETGDDLWTDGHLGVVFEGALLPEGKTLIQLVDGDTLEVLGDSEVAGYNLLTNNGSQSAQYSPLTFGYRVAQHYGLREVRRGFGGTGVTVNEGQNKIPKASLSFPYVYSGAPYTPAKMPRGVIIFTGTNEMLQNVPSTTFGPAYLAYVQQVKAARPGVPIICIVPPLCGVFTQVITSAATATGARLINCQDEVGFGNGLGPDNVHYDATGHFRIAQKIIVEAADDLSGGGSGTDPGYTLEQFGAAIRAELTPELARVLLALPSAAPGASGGIARKSDVAIVPVINPVTHVPVAYPLRVTDWDGSPVGASNNARITMTQGDTGPARQVMLVDGNSRPINLTGSTVEFHWKQTGGAFGEDGAKTVTEAATIVSAAAGLVQYALDESGADTDTPGLYEETWRVTTADGRLITYPGEGKIVVEIKPA